MRKLLVVGLILSLLFIPFGRVEAQALTQADIQTEIDSTGQGEVKLKAVTYYISAPVIIRDGIDLNGNGAELRAVTNTRIIVSEIGASNFSISKLRVNGDKQDIDVLILLNQNQNVELDRVTIENAKHTAAFLQEVTYSSVTRSNFNNNGEIGGDSALFFFGGRFNEAVGNSGYNNQNGITGLGLEYSNIDRNKFINSKLDAYNFTNKGSGQPHSVGIIATRNIGYNSDRTLSGGSGMHLNRVDYSKAAYNFFSGFGAHGMVFDGSSYNDYSWNTIRNTGWSAIAFYATYNDLTNGASHNRAAYNLIEGANQTQVSQAAIELVNEFCDNNLISGNTIRLGDSLYQRYAVFIQQPNIVGTIVIDNDLRNGYLISPIIDYGTGTILRDNLN